MKIIPIDIKKKVYKILEEFTSYELTDSTSLESAGFDSLDLVEISMELEEQFTIDISDSDFERLKTVQNICDLVQKSAQ